MSTREVGREREGEHWGKVTKMNTPGVSYCFLGTVGILTLVCSLSWAEGTWDWLNIYIYLVVFSAISWLSFGECDVIMSWGGIQALKNTSLIRLTLPPPQNQTFLSRHWHWQRHFSPHFGPRLTSLDLDVLSSYVWAGRQQWWWSVRGQWQWQLWVRGMVSVWRWHGEGGSGPGDTLWSFILPASCRGGNHRQLV